jgi:Transposase IS116/IS110/IS902 family
MHQRKRGTSRVRGPCGERQAQRHQLTRPRGRLQATREPAISSSATRGSCHLMLDVSRAPPETDAGSSRLPCVQSRTSPRVQVNAAAERPSGGPRVMPTPMPIGSQSQSVAVGPMGRRVFSRRSQTGPVGSCTLSGNAVGGVTRHEGSNPCGVAPLPASSGKTTGRHRLNRGGDRHANCALWRVVIVRLATHQPTKNDMARRTQEGMSKPEIIRCLKRYIAREIYRELIARAALAAAA